MKKLLFLISVIFLHLSTVKAHELDTIPESTNKITVGILQGGDSIVGFGFETLIS